MAKKYDLPAFPFYFGDWRKAPEIRAMDLDVRMIWFEMLGFMWESTERGFLTINGKPVSHSVITRFIGCDSIVLDRAIQQMEEFNVFSRREDGAIYCRKMVRDQEIRAAKSRAGKEGMKKRYGDFDITPDITKGRTNTETETEIENEIIEDRIRGLGKRKGGYEYPNLEQVKSYFLDNGYSEQSAVKAFNYYSVAGWKDSNGKQVRNWKQKMQSVWFKDENKKPSGSSSIVFPR